MRVLVVEDDQHLANVIAIGLRESRIEPVLAASYREALERLEGAVYAVLILDVQLPDGSGYDLCRVLRERGDQTPILMLTSRGGIEDRVAGLEAGADDYLPKPFYFQEMLARVRALSRRAHVTRARTVSIADLRVDLESGDVTRGGREIPLTIKEWELLEVLVEHVGEVVTADRIIERLWSRDAAPSAGAVRDLVSRLRRKIDRDDEPSLIHTVHGEGYRLAAATAEAAEEPGAGA